MPLPRIPHTTGALGRLFCFWLLGTQLAFATPACPPPPDTTAARVERVVDGDTLHLDDGTRVRMTWIDAPELGRRGRADEPYARAARTHLETLIGLTGSTVALAPAAARHDRYGRRLASVYSARHGDLGAHLLRNGLALFTAIPPLTDGWECQRTAEREARATRTGLWVDPPITEATALDRTGFAIVAGTAGEWSMRRDDRYLTLGGSLVLRFRDDDLERWFSDTDLDGWAGKRLEVRGWVHGWGRGGRAITVQHPAAIEIQGD